MYILDYTDTFTGVTRNKSRNGELMNVPPAVGLFYMKNLGDPAACLMPIAIQLHPDDKNYVFTPANDKYSWLLAKFHFSCAHHANHQVCIHWSENLGYHWENPPVLGLGQLFVPAVNKTQNNIDKEMNYDIKNKIRKIESKFEKIR